MQNNGLRLEAIVSRYRINAVSAETAKTERKDVALN